MNNQLGTNLSNLLSHTGLAVILSAELSTVSDAINAEQTEALELDIVNTGLRFMRVDGCYKGTTEQSFVVMCNDLHDVMRLECLGIHYYKQDSVLILDLDKSIAMLKYASCCVMIGRGLVEVANTAGLDNYILVDGEVWVIL